MPTITTPKTITLDTPAVLFPTEPPITEVTLKVPTGGMYLELGEPRYLAKTANGTMFWFEDKQAIAAYLDKCIDHPQGARIFTAMALPDMRKVREALFGFFLVTEPTTSDGSSTPSSSTPS